MAYPSILHLRKIPEIFRLRNFVVMEKIHGVPARITIDGQTARISFAADNLPGHATYFQDRPGLEGRLAGLGVGRMCFYGEYAGDGVLQKMIKYGAPDFFPFDLEIGGVMQTYGTLIKYVWQAGLAIAPILADVHGGFDTVQNQQVANLDELFESLRNRPSELARIRGITAPDNIHEGIVIKSNPLVKHGNGYLMAKLKSDNYREESGEKIHATNTLPLQAFAETYVTQNRIFNILSHGMGLTKSRKDIKPLIDLVLRDLAKEEIDEINKLRENFTDTEMRTAVGAAVAKIYCSMLDGQLIV